MLSGPSDSVTLASLVQREYTCFVIRWSQFNSAGWLVFNLKVGKLKEDKKEEFLTALKEWGLFQLTPEGYDYFFEKDKDA